MQTDKALNPQTGWFTKLLNSQLATRKLLGLDFTDTQIAGCILESFTYKITSGPCFDAKLLWTDNQ